MAVTSPLEPSSKGSCVGSEIGPSTASNLPNSSEEAATTGLPTKSSTTAATESTAVEPITSTSENLPHAMKKRTLTAAEKSEARAMKEAEAQKKADDKARKEEAKRQKEEEKRQKEEEKRQRDEERRQKQDESRREKEEKQKVKDAAKAEREAEKQVRDAFRAGKETEKKAKEEAQAKKEKSQLRLGAFFKKPAADALPSGSSSRRSSVASIEVGVATNTSIGAVDGLQSQVSEYDKTFPPFFLHAHTEVAPITRSIDEVRALWAMDQIEQGKLQPGRRPETVLGKRKRSSYMPQPAVKKLLLEMQGLSATNPIDLEMSKSDSAANILRTLPIKFLKFKEDVRPPWIGTFSKAPSGRKFVALCRNPFRKCLPGVNYDYDSEAEWEEPEEGEDLNSEGEEEEDEDEDDMEEFLDDETAEAIPKRKQLVGDLEPVYTDLNWEGPTTKTSSVLFGASTIDLQTYRLGTLLEPQITLPIDPFSTSYWTNSTPKALPKPSTQNSLQPLARVPLNTIKGLNQSLLANNSEPNTKPVKPQAAAKPLPPELMSDFKKAVSGSNLSKVGLIEVLKKDFPQITKKTVEQTLLLIARRVGKKESEKTWQILE